MILSSCMKILTDASNGCRWNPGKRSPILKVNSPRGGKSASELRVDKLTLCPEINYMDRDTP